MGKLQCPEGDLCWNRPPFCSSTTGIHCIHEVIVTFDNTWDTDAYNYTNIDDVLQLRSFIGKASNHIQHIKEQNIGGKMPIMRKLTIIWHLVCYLVYAGSQDNRRPFYNIGHMANSIYDVTTFLNQGANGVETDINFSPSGQPAFNFHGFPCDCFRICLWSTNFIDYLIFIRQITTPGSPMFNSQMTFLMLDLKVSDLYPSVLYDAGKQLAYAVMQYLFQNGSGIQPQVWIVLTVPGIQMIPVLVGFTNYFVEQNMTQYLYQFGYDVYSNEDPLNIVTALANAGITNRIWMSDGITNCLPRLFNRLKKIVDMRDNPAQHVAISKVYTWTIDGSYLQRTVLRLNVDAVLTNQPATLAQILQESEFVDKFRLANIDDVPWID